MPPKRRPKAKAKGKAKAKPKAKPAAKAKARGHPMVRLRGILKRPSGRARRGPKEKEELQEWSTGGTVELSKVAVSDLLRTAGVVIEDARYFHSECKIAGRVLGMVARGDQPMLRLLPTGTTSEGLLRWHTGSPNSELLVHLCPKDCNYEMVADYIAHGLRGRILQAPEAEEAWTTNLVGGGPPLGGDELAELRRRSSGLAPGGAGDQSGQVDSSSEKDSDKKKKKDKEKGKKEKDKKEKDKKEKKAKKKKKKSSSSSSVALDGRHAKQASVKTARALFGGTGLDPRERVRGRVARRARKLLRKASDKESGSSKTGSGESTSSSEKEAEVEEGLFSQSTKIRRVAESFPGALTAQALSQMQESLLQTWGEESQGEIQKGIPVQYFRQVLQRRVGGPQAREMQTIATTLDLIL